MGEDRESVRRDLMKWRHRLDCIAAGYAGFKRPLMSVVLLACDFHDPDLQKLVIKSFQSIQRTAPHDAELIVVANAPSAGLTAFLNETQITDDRLVVVSSTQNLGVAAKNFGYNLAQGEFIFSIDSDVIMHEEGWAEKCIYHLKANPEVALVGPCGGRLHLESWSPTKWGCGGSMKGSYFGYENTNFFGDTTVTGVNGTALDVIPSMFWCFRRDVLDQVGYLDWRFGPFVGSDSDFCFKLKVHGWQIELVRVPIIHENQGSMSHKHMLLELEEIRLDHIAQLYYKWYPHREAVCEMAK